jgi:hypothetical protein
MKEKQLALQLWYKMKIARGIKVRLNMRGNMIITSNNEEEPIPWLRILANSKPESRFVNTTVDHGSPPLESA